MKKHLFLTALVLALVMCFSLGVCAHGVDLSSADPNKYEFTDELKAGVDTDDLWIGTLNQWKAAAKAVGDTATVFENGEAIHGDDLIITNGEVGVVLAVGTRNPWGYPAGSILDAGTFEEGLLGNIKGNRDMTWSIETLINDWDAWGPNNCGTVTFDLVAYDFEAMAEVEEGGLTAVKVSRVYDIDGIKFDVISYYGIAPGANFVYAYDYLENTAGTALSSNGDDWTIGNAFCITNKGDDGGAMFDMYATRSCPIVGSYGESDATGAKYSISVVVPGQNVTSAGKERPINNYYGAVGYKGLYSFYDWAVDESVTYEKYVVISDSPGLAETMDFYHEAIGAELTTYEGTVDNTDAAVVVYQGEKVYAWYEAAEDGSFSFDIPNDDKDYFYNVECAGCVATEKVALGEETNLGEIAVGEAKDALEIVLKDQNGNPVWGKVEFLKEYPTVRYTGDSIFQAKEKGVINALVNDIEDFDATVFGQGHYFYSSTVAIDETDVKDGKVEVVIDMKYALPEGWLAGDMHHHANKNDAFADPEDAIPSMLAAGLDIGILTDHDFTVNNYEGYQKAVEYGMSGYLPSEEISCSWAHFNVIPQNLASYEYFLDKHKENHVMNQFADMPDFVEQTHEYGATITANHPWYSYGLFYSYGADALPNDRYTEDFDNIEINSCCRDSENFKVLRDAFKFWTAYITGEEDATYGYVSKPHYLVGGSDTHDVLYPGVANNKGHTAYVTYATGKIRTVAETNVVENDLKRTAIDFGNSVANGNSYVTLGPILDLDQTPGEVYLAENGVFNITMDIDSLTTLQDIVILASWADDTYTYQGMNKKAAAPEDQTVYNVYDVIEVAENTNSYSLDVDVEMPYGVGAGWVSVMVVDSQTFHMFAITNPYWVLDATAYELPFTDVTYGEWTEGDYFAEAVEWAYFSGITSGKTETTFAPKDACTRAQAVTFLYRAAGEPAASDTEIAFTDVADDAYYHDAVVWAIENGITTGTTATTFSPNAPVTRAQMVTFLYRAAGAPAVEEAELAFTDVAKDKYYYNAVQWAVANGITAGVTDTLFAPNNICDRAQTVTFLYRAN